MIFLLLLFLIISLFLEGTVTTLPLLFVCLLCLLIQRRDASIFPIAFLIGFLLDILTLHVLGASSLFFLFSLFLIFLYQRKYEIRSIPFVIIASCIGSWIFLTVFGYKNAFLQAGISAIIAAFLFKIVNRDQNGNIKYQN
jgi:hypothetical protein